LNSGTNSSLRSGSNISGGAGASGLGQSNTALPPGQTGANFQGSGQNRAALQNSASPGSNAAGRANIDINAPGMGVDVNAGRGTGGSVDINRQGGSGLSGRFGGAGGAPGANLNVGNDNWRMVRYNNEWWYYTPQNTWMYHRDNNWQAYDANNFRPLERYRTAFRGLNQNMDERRDARSEVRDSRQQTRETARDNRMENRDTRQDARQSTRDSIQDNRDQLRDQRQDSRRDIQNDRSEMRNDIQQNRMNNQNTNQNNSIPNSSTPSNSTQNNSTQNNSTQGNGSIPSLPAPPSSDGSIGGANGQ